MSNTRTIVVPNSPAPPDGYVVVYNVASGAYIVESPSVVFNSVNISPNFGQQTVTGGVLAVNNGTTTPVIISGAGAPTNTSFPNGSLYMRTDGTTTTGLYTLEAGTWAALGTGGGGGNTVYSGSGAPVAFHNNGDIYFDISQTPAQGYVQELVTVSPTIDGSVTGIFSSTASFTTPAIACSSNCKLLVMMICFENSSDNSVSTVTSAGLTFTRHSFVDNGGANSRFTRIEVWSAPVTTSLNQSISITLGAATDDASVYCFGLDNINTSSPFESGADVTGFNGTGVSSLTLTGITTTNPNDLWFYAIGANQSGPPSWATASGFTKLVDVYNTGAVQFSELQVCNQSLISTVSSASINTGLTTAIAAAALSFAVKGVSGGTTTWIAFGGTPPLNTTFARLPPSPYVGQRVVITDSTTTTFNAVASGGSTNTIMVWWNGTNWVVG